MTPANPRSMTRGAGRGTICRAALYSVAGICRCPRCYSEPPAEGATTAAPDAAAVRQSGLFPSGGGNTDPQPRIAAIPLETSGGAYPAPEPTAAARPLDRRECSPGGGLFGGDHG